LDGTPSDASSTKAESCLRRYTPGFAAVSAVERLRSKYRRMATTVDPLFVRARALLILASLITLMSSGSVIVQFEECTLDISLRQFRTVPAHDHDFRVAVVHQLFDGLLEAFGEG